MSNLPNELDAVRTSLDDAKRRLEDARIARDNARHEAFVFVCKNEKAAWKRKADGRPARIVWTNIGREIQQVGVIISPSSLEHTLSIDEFIKWFSL